MTIGIDRPRPGEGSEPVDPDPDAPDPLAATQPVAAEVMRAVRLAAVQRGLFGDLAEPVRLDRFVIMDRLGSGAMGVVFAAYDPRLDRRVALKLVAPDSGGARKHATDRLLREAQALARLSHPNVVPVHDAGVIDSAVFLVMEHVAGETLKVWAEAEPRSWREVVDVYAQAGRGLAAAHARGLVHRDFKPANAILGEDGRVRVLDFGLVRKQSAASADGDEDLDPAAGAASDSATGAASDSATGAASDSATGTASDSATGAVRASAIDTASDAAILNSGLTRTNAIVGTPAYMSPEQLAGGEVGPASDQFSFCVSLYEALYGQRPYAGTTLAALSDAVASGQLREPPRSTRVPRWLFPIVRRGLAPAPADRYPSMAALVAALARDPARTRRRMAVAAGLVIAAIAGAWLFALGASPAVAVCERDERALADVWPARRAEVARALGVDGADGSYRDEVWERVAGGLDAYAAGWVAAGTDACMAHRRGVQSGAMLDRRMACLERRRVALATAVDVLVELGGDRDPSGAPAGLARAVDVVVGLPPLAYCADTEALAAQVPPPERPEVARRVAALRDRLARATALEHAGRLGDARAMADAAATEAEKLDYPPVLAESLLIAGRAGMQIWGEREGAIPALGRALTVGLGAGQDALVLEALARRIYVEGLSATSSLATDDRMLALLLGLGTSLAVRAPDSEFGHALLLSNMGSVYFARGDRDRARALFERGAAIRDRLGERAPVELTVLDTGLAKVTSDPERRAALLSRALDDVERAFGPTHPNALVVRTSYARAVASARRARELVAPACAGYERHPRLVQDRARCGLFLGILDADLGDTARAAEQLARLAAQLPPEIGTQRSLVLGYARLWGGDPAAALEPFASVVKKYGETSDTWWVAGYIGRARVGEGLAAMAQGRPVQAVRALSAAESLLAGIADTTENQDHRRWLALTRASLADALWDTAANGEAGSAQRTRAVALTDLALAWYRDAGAGYEQRVRELSAAQEMRARAVTPPGSRPAGAPR